MNKMRHLLLALPLLLTGACSVDRIPGVYRIDVQQGNVVTREMVDQLRPGMNRDQVRFVMGSPMLTDTFNTGRWDYFYSFEPGSGDREQRLLTVWFESDRYVRVSGDVPTAAGGENDAARTVQVTGELEDRRGFLRRAWDALTDWGDDN